MIWVRSMNQKRIYIAKRRRKNERLRRARLEKLGAMWTIMHYVYAL